MEEEEWEGELVEWEVWDVRAVDEAFRAAAAAAAASGAAEAEAAALEAGLRWAAQSRRARRSAVEPMTTMRVEATRLPSCESIKSTLTHEVKHIHTYTHTSKINKSDEFA